MLETSSVNACLLAGQSRSLLLMKRFVALPSGGCCHYILVISQVSGRHHLSDEYTVFGLPMQRVFEGWSCMMEVHGLL